MKITLLFVFFCLSYFAIGQVDSIEREILNYKNSTPEIISKGRRLLIDKFLDEDYQKMREIKDYLIKNIDDNHYQSFDPDEYLLLLFWTQDYQTMLAGIETNPINLAGLNNETIITKMVPVSDNLYQELLDKSIENKVLLGAFIQNSDLNNEEIDFLVLYLNYCLNKFTNDNITQDSLNLQCNTFLVKYPSSVYNQYVKKEIQYLVSVSDLAFGYDFFIGYGAFSGSMNKYVNNFAPLGFSMDFCFSNFDINTTLGLGFAKLNQSVVYKNFNWDKNFAINIFYPQATIGYTFFAKKRFNFNPYFGVYSLMVTPDSQEIQNDPALTNVYINSGPSLVGGISLNLYSKSSNNTSNYNKSYQFQGFVKLKYAYYKSGFETGFSSFNGDMSTVCVTFGALMRKVYRL